MNQISDILESIGYPQDTLTVDFETYYDRNYSLRKLNTHEYLADPRFEILGVATKRGNDPATFDECTPITYYGNTTIVVLNAPFDISVFHKLHGFIPPFLIDVLALARYYSARQRNDLGSLSKRWGLPEKGETLDFIGLRRNAMTADQLQALSTYACNDAENTYKLAEHLLPKIGNLKDELAFARQHVLMQLNRELHLDIPSAEKATVSESSRLAALVAKTGYSAKQISGTKSFIERLQTLLNASDESIDPYMKNGKLGRILAVAKKDASRSVLLNHPSELIRDLMVARSEIKSAPLHLKRLERLSNLEKRCGYVPVQLSYHRAITGRSAGIGGVNMQNFAKNSNLDARKFLIPKAGNVFISCDLAAIEARVLAFLSQQVDLLDLFRQNKDAYCDLASEIYGRPIVRDGSKEMEDARQIGKVAVLGLGYGMGAAKFSAMNKVDIELAQKVVNVYRAKNDKIVRFWKGLDSAFRAAAINGYSIQQVGPFRFCRNTDQFGPLQTMMPGGRWIRWHNAKFDPADGGVIIKGDFDKKPDRYYGGKICADLVQGTARDILMSAVLRAEQEMPIVIHIHDSIVASVPKEMADEKAKRLQTIMVTPPAWLEGIPLDAKYEIKEHL